jgi:hypothetical protein
MMQQDSNQQQEPPHILGQVVVLALPAEFQHADIGRQYQDGEFTNRLDAEIEDILRGGPPAGKSDETAPITLSGDAASALEGLHCIALIQGGLLLPLLDIEQVTAPLTTAQKARLYHAAARTLLEAIAAIYEDQAQRAKRQDDDHEGDGCFV